MCQPKEIGGGGFKELQLINESFLLKLIWRIKMEPDALWTQVLHGKYRRDRDHGEEPIAKPADSQLRKDLVKMWEKFNQYAFMKIHNDAKACVWTDNLLKGEGRLINYVTGEQEINKRLRVKELMNEEGRWDLSSTENLIPTHIAEKIKSLPPLRRKEEDQLVWKASTNGEFTTKSTYKLLQRFFKVM